MFVRGFITFLLCSLFSLFHAAAQVQTLVLKPGASQGKDANIRDDMAGIPQLNSQDFIANAWTASGTSFIQRSLIYFNLDAIPPSAVINSAYLNLFSNPTTGHYQHHSSLSGPNTCLLMKIIQPWDESTVTWNNQPTTSITNQVILPQSSSSMQNYFNIDVTALITDQFTNPSGNFGFLMRLVTESQYRCMSFSSSDHTDSTLWPELIITFQCLAPVVGLIAPDTVCAGSMINFGNNSSNASSYYWEFGDGTGSTAANPIHSYTQAGSFLVSLVANNECDTADSSTLIVVIPIPQVNLGEDSVLCPGQSLLLSPGNHFSSYLWNNASTDSAIMVDISGVYWVEITDTNGCSNQDTIVVHVVPEPVINLGNDTIVCIGLTVVLNPGNGFTSYHWNTGDTTQTITTGISGEYCVTVTYNGYCSGMDTVLIDFQPGNMISLGPDTTSCEGAAVILSPGPGYAQYYWNNGLDSMQINVCTSGSYVVSVIRPDGCFDADTVNVYFDPAPVTVVDTTICLGTGYYAGGTIQYTSGTYKDTLHFAGSCDSIVITNLFIKQKYTGFLGNDTSFCANDGLTLNAGSWFTNYLWQSGDTNQLLHITNGGLYSIVVHDSSGCIGKDSILVLKLPDYLSQHDVFICDGDSVLTGGTFQHFSGDYFDTLSTINGCDSVIMTHLTVNPVFQIHKQSQICVGDSVLLAGSYQFLPGIYYDSLNSINGCDSTIITMLKVNLLPLLTLPTDTSACADTSLLLNPGITNGQYLWSTGSVSQLISVNQTGMYRVTVTDSSGCVNFDSCYFLSLPLPAVIVVPLNATICIDSSITLLSHGASSYTWSPLPGLQFVNDSTVNVIPPEGSHQYFVTGTSSQGCRAVSSSMIYVVPPPESHLADTISLCDGIPAVLDPETNCDTCSFLWQDGIVAKTFSAYEPGFYWVVIANGGCEVSDTVEVKDCFEIWVPNIFTPNGDGINETFHPETLRISHFIMYIFNRWGQLICETDDYQKGWDGTVEGNKCPDGVYYFLIRYSLDGTAEHLAEVKGAVTIMR